MIEIQNSQITYQPGGKLKNEAAEQTKLKIRIDKGIGKINVEEASWIRKSIEEMTPKEYQEYNRLNKRFCRRNMDEDKKDKVRSKDKELICKVGI